MIPCGRSLIRQSRTFRKNQLRSNLFLAIGLFLCHSPVAFAQNVITVHDTTVTNRITRYMTGACMEDVNHEVYGGIYSQMIFGESFQEPSVTQLQNFITYGGTWSVSSGVLSVAGTNGPKLVLDSSSCTSGEAGVEVNLGNNAGPSGFIIKVTQPGVGADNFYGYEIAIASGFVRIAKHENNYTLLRDIAYTVSTNQWVTLRVKMTGSTMTVFVNTDSVASYTDNAPLSTGSIGLRAWSDGTTSFRNMWVNTSGMVRNITFTQATGGISGMWNVTQKGSATGSFGMDTQSPFKGTQSQKITFTSGSGEIGIENRGLNRQGMYFVANQPYEGYVWVRVTQPADVTVAIESSDGSTVYDDSTMHATSTSWARLDFTLTPTATVNPGRFAIKLKQAGAVTVGHAFLQPGAWGRFQGLPVRKDVAEGLLAQKLTVMRYGGSMINHGEYRWKNQIGPRDRRPMTGGTWYPYSSNGWGMFDFLNFCEQAGFLGVPVVNSYETAQDLADFIEYVNSPAASVWGAKRAADGHAAPYNLKYVEIGNEEAVNTNYFNRFKPMAEAIWPKDSSIILVVGDFGYDNVINDPYNFTGSWSGITTLAAQKQILDLAKSYNREVWFDIHINTNAPPDPTNIPAINSFYDQLGNITPGAKYKLVNFELNCFSSHSLARALANAHAINELERMSDRLAICCSANCLQVDGQNDNGWDQGLLFMNPEKVWAQPPYYITQMASGHYQPLCIPAGISGNLGTTFDLTATKSENGQELVLQAVNMGSAQIRSRVSFDRYTAFGKAVSITTLTGALNAVNTASNPMNVVPTVRNITAGASDTFSFPANSFTVIHFSPSTSILKTNTKKEPDYSIQSTAQGIKLTWNRPVAGYSLTVSILNVKGIVIKRLKLKPGYSAEPTVIAWDKIAVQGRCVASGSYIISVTDEKGHNALFKTTRIY